MGFSYVYFIMGEAGSPTASNKTQNSLLTKGSWPGITLLKCS